MLPDNSAWGYSPAIRLLSIDPFRTLHVPSVHYLKPELMFGHRGLIAVADWILFPKYW